MLKILEQYKLNRINKRLKIERKKEYDELMEIKGSVTKNDLLRLSEFKGDKYYYTRHDKLVTHDRCEDLMVNILQANVDLDIKRKTLLRYAEIYGSSVELHHIKSSASGKILITPWTRAHYRAILTNLHENDLKEKNE